MPHTTTTEPAHAAPAQTGKPVQAPAAAAAQAPPSFASHADLLRWLYADLTRLERVAAPTLLLHRFNDAGRPPLRGAAAAQAHEEGLVAATRGTLVMDVESVVANAHFGSVMGTLRAGGDGGGHPPLAVPFCGLWRFDAQGRLAEHWENVAVETSVVERWFREEAEAEAAAAAAVNP